MDKAFADEMINKYQKKFFGFALNKCSSFIEAEELASRITCEAYMTLRTVEEVYNWEGYLYRIAHNVYVHYVREQAKHRKTELDENEPIEHKDYAAEYADKEELEVLKREVAFIRCKSTVKGRNQTNETKREFRNRTDKDDRIFPYWNTGRIGRYS